MLKKILITGSNGLTGQKLIGQLLGITDFEFLAASKGPNRCSLLTEKNYQSVDLTIEEEVKQIICYYQPDVVIHTAAMTNVDACENDHDACDKLNVHAVSYLISALKSFVPGAHFIHLSTDFIFDGEQGPYREEAVPNPLSYYGHSKWKAEQLVIQSGLKYSILRTVLVYGLVEQMSRSNIVLWVKDSLEQHKTISVVTDQFRSPTLAEDLAAACILTAQTGKTGIYHISGKDQMSVYELALRVARFFKLDETLIVPSLSVSINQPAKRPPRTGFVISKAIRDLQYSPHSFEEGLAIVEKQLNKTSLT